MSTQSWAAVTAHVSQVIADVAGTHERVTVTKNGGPVAVLLAVEDYESLLETLEILSDRSAVADIGEAKQQMAQRQSSVRNRCGRRSPAAVHERGAETPFSCPSEPSVRSITTARSGRGRWRRTHTRRKAAAIPARGLRSCGRNLSSSAPARPTQARGRRQPRRTPERRQARSGRRRHQSRTESQGLARRPKVRSALADRWISGHPSGARCRDQGPRRLGPRTVVSSSNRGPSSPRETPRTGHAGNTA
jgi:prevent-host-death family protein